MRISTVFTLLISILLLITGCGDQEQENNNPNGFYQRGIKSYHRGEYEDAAEFFEKAIIFEPDNPAPYLAAAEIYDDYLNNNTRAAECYIRYIALSENIELRNLAMAALKESQAEQEPGADAATVDETGILRKNIQQLVKEKQNLSLKLVNAEQKNQDVTVQLQEQTNRAKRYKIGRFGLLAIPAVILITALTIVYLLPIIKRTRPAHAPKKQRENMIHNIFGTYHMIEDGAKIANVLFERSHGNDVTVTVLDEEGLTRTSGTGTIERGCLDVVLKNAEDYEARTRFEFHDHGITFTAAWRDNNTTGMAAGIRESSHYVAPKQTDEEPAE